MSGRAVGGAAGAGCGVLSLVGVLASVGLVVWLGSQAIDLGGGEPTAAPSSVPVPSTDATTARATLTLGAGGPFADGDEVAVGGRGFAPGPIELTTCLAHEARSSGGLLGCDPSTTVSASVASDGLVVGTYRVPRVVVVADVAYDCAAFAGACQLVAHPPGDPSTGIVADLAIEGSVAVDAQRPPGG